ncbi:MAG TPA: transglutaminase domain-containing protein [Thermomicrobiales bacterium]|nr:transglutaminase domain-containing protein [Thermomicrobiales bacterium]
MPQAILDRYLQLPDTVTDRTRALAADVTQGAQSPYDQARAIETYLRNSIEYTEDVEFPPEDRDVVDFVLFDSHKGYCEYYASAFIVMARSVGLPTRMVTGFFPADRDNDAGGFLYRERNAHAWPEVYLAGYGWVPFEPTAARNTFNREPAAAPNPAAGAIDRESGGVGGPLPDDSEFLRDQNDLPTGSGVGSIDTQEPVTRLEWGIRGAIAVLMLATLALAFFWLRGLRGLSPTGQLYAKTVRGADWGGIAIDPSMTPSEMARSVADEVPGSRGPATYLADLYVRETYGGRPVPQTDLLRGRQAWLRLRGLLVKHFFSRLAPWRGRRGDDLEDDAAW